jgi:carbamoylphosphate synthase large subunit
MSSDKTVLCIACYFKGVEFLKTCKTSGARVLLLTLEKLSGANWPDEYIDETFYLPGEPDDWDRDTLIKGVSHVARSEAIDRIVALDDLDLEKAALLREHLRVPGLGETATRHVRDKLAMRQVARDAGIPVPPFIAAVNASAIEQFMRAVPAPWIMKPRSQAAATGMSKLYSPEDVWHAINARGDHFSEYLIEQFVPGDIFHVDSLIVHGTVPFARPHRYRKPPMTVAHDGGVFATHSMDPADQLTEDLLALNERVLLALGHRHGCAHTEFIRAADGSLFFLETGARVGGAHISDLVLHCTGLNLWSEWARIELLDDGEPYAPVPERTDHGGLLVALSRQEWPDLSSYDDPEVVWRLRKHHHAGLIVTSPSLDRVLDLMRSYETRIAEDFLATMPAPDKPVA